MLMNFNADENNKGLKSKKKEEKNDEDKEPKFISKGFNAAPGKVRPSR